MPEYIFSPKDCYPDVPERLSIDPIADCFLDTVPHIRLNEASTYFTNFNPLPLAQLNTNVRIPEVEIPLCCECDDFRFVEGPFAAYEVNSEWALTETVYPASTFRVGFKYEVGENITVVNDPEWEVMEPGALGFDSGTDPGIAINGTPVHDSDQTGFSDFDVLPPNVTDNEEAHIKVRVNLEKDGIESYCEKTLKVKISKTIPVKITGAGSDDGLYEFLQQEWVSGAWADKSGGMTHTELGEAHEVNLSPGIPDDVVVYLRPSRFMGDTGDVVWEFEYGGATPSVLFAVIEASTSIGDNRWRYTIAEAEYQKQGEWQTKEGGISSTQAFNTIEANNAASGIQGNGVNVSRFPTGVEMQPIGIGAVVEVTMQPNCDTGDPEYVFQAVNQADGLCEA